MTPRLLPLALSLFLGVSSQIQSQETPSSGAAPAVVIPAESEAPPRQKIKEQEFEGIVRVENAAIVPDYATPWNPTRPSGGSGTGFLIGENKFLTNAHVVSDSSRLIIRKVGDPEPHLARIVHIAHDCDLAILELVDPTPFTGVEPLKIGDVPLLNTEVIAVGYPIGGERISITRGVVSRIDFRNYSHSGVDMHLTIQVDAAINPGNSGGPVLQDGKVVGVAFQGYSGSVAQNVGYMIPTPVIKRLLEDTKDGSYDRYVDLSLTEFQIQNPAQLKALGLPNNGIGVLVSDVDSGGSSGGKILPGDVLLAIDGNPIFNNGLINVEGDLVNMNEIVERKFAGDTIGLKVWRDKKAIDVEVTLKPFAPYRVLGNQYGKRPQYLVFCGLVFQPMDRAVIAAHSIEDQLVNYYFNYFTTDEIYKEHPEVIILTKVLTDAINSDVGGFVHKIVDEVDGKKIRNLSDLNTAFTEALAKPGDGFITIKLLEEGRPIVLDRARAKEAHARILKTYGVAEDHFIDPTRAADSVPSAE